MLITPDSYLYTYAITRDFGFAPNPFNGICTLATCKPRVRKAANIGDWVMGIGGSDLNIVKRKCIFLMRVSEKLNFQEYWEDSRYLLKRPSRNGSRVQMLGDNIYHYNQNQELIQEDSHHSNPDGSPNVENLRRDTNGCDQVLISNYFFYFGSAAIEVDLNSIGFIRIRDFKKTNLNNSNQGKSLIKSVVHQNQSSLNLIVADPCQFMDSHKRVDQSSGRVS